MASDDKTERTEVSAVPLYQQVMDDLKGEIARGGFFREVEEAENRGATAEELKTLLGKGRAKKGMFEGDLDNGELEIGQVASLFREQQTAAEIVHDIVTEYRNLLNESKEKLSI